jgi:hypothetical protein
MTSFNVVIPWSTWIAQRPRPYDREGRRKRSPPPQALMQGVHIMQMAAEQEYAHIGETHGAEDHDHDLIHELSKRLDSVWRIDQYIANADGKPEIQSFWRQLKSQEVKTVERLKELVKEEVKANCF